MELGVDVVEIPRIAKRIRDLRFLKKIFTPEEIRYCAPKRHAAQHYAVRFAAKEAVWKALGSKGLSHRDIRVENDARGKPVIRLAAKWKRYEKRLKVSLTHGREVAIAIASYEG